MSPKTFDSIITKARGSQPAAVLYYKNDKVAKGFIDQRWQSLASELKGMAKIAGVDCSEYSQFCQSHKAQLDENNSYHVSIYPPLPFPPYPAPKDILDDSDKLKRTLLSHIPRKNVEVVNDVDQMEIFMSRQIALPKVLLFSDKPKPPSLFHAVANSFSDRMMFSFVPSSSEALMKKFHVKKVPSLIVKRGDRTISARGAEYYNGPLNNFLAIHDFINIRSETFVKGGGFIESDPIESANRARDAKPWAGQKVPELTKASHQDVCFKKKNGYCLIYVTNDKSHLTNDNKTTILSQSEKEMLERIVDEFDERQSAPFHVSYLNADREKFIAKAFSMETSETSTRKFPSALIFNPHKRLRWTAMDEEKVATEENIREFVNRIIDGEGRFKVVKGNELPPFVSRTRASNNNNTNGNEKLAPAKSPGRDVKVSASAAGKSGEEL